jgi:hypothetical protein
MRTIVIFSFWLIAKTLTESVAKRGFSYRITATLISIGLVLILITFAQLILIF